MNMPLSLPTVKCGSKVCLHVGFCLLQAEVVGVTVHPSKKYAITASADCTWCFYDLEAATCLKQVSFVTNWLPTDLLFSGLVACQPSVCRHPGIQLAYGIPPYHL